MVYRVGYTLLLAGARGQARHALKHAEALSRTLNAPYWLCRTLLATAELVREDGDRDQGHRLATAALELAGDLQHRDFVSKAKALLEHGGASQRPHGAHRAAHMETSDRAGLTGRKDRRSSTNEAVPGLSLPEVPRALEAPVHGVDAVIGWLDELVDRQLRAFQRG
jgi:hypothetical protein